MSDPKLRSDLIAAWDPEVFAAKALRYAKSRNIALNRAGLESRSDPAGVERFMPRAPDGTMWPPPGWLPAGLSAGAGGVSVDWLCFDGLETGTPFFADAIQRARARPFNRLFTWRMGLGDMLRNAPHSSPPAGLIFHMSRCGSTLVHRMIDASGAARSLSEASLFEETLQLCLTGPAADGAKHQLLRTAAAGLNNFAGEKPLVLKLDSWHILSWSLIRAAFPHTPAIFLYRDPAEVLVSQRRMRGVQAIPQPEIAALCGIADYSTLSLDEYCAQFLAASCRAAADAARAGAVRVIHFERLPGAVVDEVLPYFGIQAGGAAQARMREAAGFYSKSPNKRYVADGEEKLKAAGDNLRVLAERIVGPSYRALDVLAG